MTRPNLPASLLTLAAVAAIFGHAEIPAHWLRERLELLHPNLAKVVQWSKR